MRGSRGQWDCIKVIESSLTEEKVGSPGHPLTWNLRLLSPSYYLLDSLFDDPVFHSENPIADGSDPFIVCDDN